MPQPLHLVDSRVLRPSETALALGLVSEVDLLRLKTLARLHARGLPPDVGWEDLLQEALTRVLVGSRLQPQGVVPVAFIAGVMRSLRSDHWRRLRQGPADSRDIDLADPAPDPERSLSAVQELAAIRRLFANDALALRIIAGLGKGQSAEEIRIALKISRTDYDSARKRMRRCLLREGLTCAPK